MTGFHGRSRSSANEKIVDQRIWSNFRIRRSRDLKKMASFCFPSRSLDNQGKYWPLPPSLNRWWEKRTHARWIRRWRRKSNVIKFSITSCIFIQVRNRIRWVIRLEFSASFFLLMVRIRWIISALTKITRIIGTKETLIFGCVISKMILNWNCHGFHTNLARKWEDSSLGPMAFFPGKSAEQSEEEKNKQVTFDLGGNWRFLTRTWVLLHMHIDSTNRSQICVVGKSRSDLLT